METVRNAPKYVFSKLLVWVLREGPPSCLRPERSGRPEAGWATTGSGEFQAEEVCHVTIAPVNHVADSYGGERQKGRGETGWCVCIYILSHAAVRRRLSEASRRAWCIIMPGVSTRRMRWPMGRPCCGRPQQRQAINI